MQNDLTYFQNQINNLTLLHPFRNNSDILIISDASEKGIGASIFQIRNYQKIDKYFESDLDICNINQINLNNESKKCPKEIQPPRDNFQSLRMKNTIKRLNSSKITNEQYYTIFDYIYKRNGTEELLT